MRIGVLRGDEPSLLQGALSKGGVYIGLCIQRFHPVLDDLCYRGLSASWLPQTFLDGSFCRLVKGAAIPATQGC